MVQTPVLDNVHCILHETRPRSCAMQWPRLVHSGRLITGVLSSVVLWLVCFKTKLMTSIFFLLIKILQDGRYREFALNLGSLQALGTASSNLYYIMR